MMSDNLIDLFKNTVGDQFGQQMGGLLGESEDKVSSALSAGVPAVLGGLMKKASTDEGAGELASFLEKDEHGGLLDNLGGLFGGGDNSNVMSGGLGILKGLLGDKVGGLLDVISNVSGIGRNSSQGLMGMIAPIVIGMISKKMKGSGMGVGGLVEMLMGQKKHVAAALPAGLGDSLGFADLLKDDDDGILDKAGDAVSGAAGAVAGTAGDAVDKVKDVAGGAADAASRAGGAAVDTAKDAAAAGGSMLGKLIPLILLAVLGFLAWSFMKGCKKDEPEVKAPEVNAPAVEWTADNAAAETGKIFEGLGTTMSGITDADSATAALPELATSTAAVSGLSDKLSSLPGPVQGIIKNVIGEKLGGLLEMVAKVKAIPGVGAILGDKVDALVGMLQGFNN